MSCPNTGDLSNTWMPPFNMLSNPGFNFCQLYTPTSYTTISDGAIAADCWRVTRENSDVQYKRNTGSFASPFQGSFKKITNAGKIAVYQPLENILSLGLGGHNITATFFFSLSAAYDLYLTIWEWTGTADSTGPLVSTWNAGGTEPTWGTNWTRLFQFKSVNTSSGLWTWAISYGTTPTSPSNLAIGFYSDQQVAVNDTIDAAQLGLYVGSEARFTWTPLNPDDDLARCQRFIEKTYGPDILPGTSTDTDEIATNQVTTTHLQQCQFRTRKVKTPTITFYNPTTGGTGTWRDPNHLGGTNLNMSVNGGTSGTGGFTAAVSSGTGFDGDQLNGHYVADASI